MPKGVGVRVPLLAPSISDLAPKTVRTNCVQNKEEIEDFTWRVSECEELVGGYSQEMMGCVGRYSFISNLNPQTTCS